MSTTLMALADVTVPERARRDLGDIAGLAESITRLGMLHPIVVAGGGRLVAGQRRLAAAESLGWETVPVTVATNLDSAARLLIAERDENTCRKDMTVSEKVELGRAIEALEIPAARERMTLGSREPRVDTARVREKVGEALGMSGASYERARAVVTAAETGEPVAVAARERMDRTDAIRPAFEAVRRGGAPAPTTPGPVVTPVNGDSYSARQLVNAEAAKNRMWQSLHMLDVLGQELPTTKLHLMAPATTPDELTEMVGMVDRAIRSLRGFRDQLKSRSEA